MHELLEFDRLSESAILISSSENHSFKVFVDFWFDRVELQNIINLCSYGSKGYVSVVLGKETITAIRMLYKSTKVKFRSPDGDTDFFEIIAGTLWGDTLAPYLFIICQDYVLRTPIDLMKEKGFTLNKKARSRRFPASTITDADYADDISLLANTPTQAKSLMYSLEQVAGGMDLHRNAD